MKACKQEVVSSSEDKTFWNSNETGNANIRFQKNIPKRDKCIFSGASTFSHSPRP